MITKEQAVNSHHRQEFYFVGVGYTVKRCRVNGKCKTWKTRPTEFELPMKYGLRECFYIHHNNSHQFFSSVEEVKQSITVPNGKQTL